VDELDKIVDFEEIRAFVRRIKAIFEVPGVYYYVSLAEDTLTSLYLGPAAGKNEIDSAFDHIIRVPALKCCVSEKIAFEYLMTHGLTEQPPKLTRMIATLSFGIPRDVIRRCDELIALENRASIGPGQLAFELRTTQARMGYELHHLSKAQRDELSTDAETSAVKSRTISNNGMATESGLRLVLSIWLICLVEVAAHRLGDAEWLLVTEELSETGYRLPVDSTVDLQFEIEKLHTRIMG
jgi:hypothetical protein